MMKFKTNRETADEFIKEFGRAKAKELLGESWPYESEDKTLKRLGEEDSPYANLKPPTDLEIKLDAVIETLKNGTQAPKKPFEPDKAKYIASKKAEEAAAIAAEPKEPAEPREKPPGDIIPEAPSEEEQLDLYRNTHFQTFVDGARTVAPICPAYSWLGAMALQSAMMTPCVRVRGKKPNFFGLTVGEQSSGKGTILNGLVQCLSSLELETIPKASSKSFLKKIAIKPWGTMAIGEFAAYVKSDWLSDALYNLNDAYDGLEVGESSEKTGNVIIRNAAPNLLGCIQANKFLSFSMKEFLESGFFARTLIALYERKPSEWERLSLPGETVMIDPDPITMAFKAFYGWLPAAMTPSEERTKTIFKDGKEDEVKHLGEWVHPIANINMKVEPFASVWNTHYFPAELKDVMQRLVNNYLPLLSIPFVEPLALKEWRITADAQARGQRAMLVFYHNFARLSKIVPENDRGAILIKNILNKILREPGVSRKVINRDVYHDTNEAFDKAMTVIETRPLARIENRINRNGTVSNLYYPIEEKGEKMQPLPPIVIKPENKDIGEL